MHPLIDTSRHRRARHVLRLINRAAALLVLPLSFLLFAQWPLRDWIQAYSRDANDLAQWIFALYAAIAVSYATRQRAHLRADVLAHRYSARTRRRIERLAAALVLAPWAAFMLYAGSSLVWESLRQLEGFPDTYNPGYFMVKVALWLLCFMVLVQALLDAFVPDEVQS